MPEAQGHLIVDMSRKCKGCSNNIVNDSVKCTKCEAEYHPSCSKAISVLPNGAFQKCCGPKRTISLEDIRELIREGNRSLRGEIQADSQKSIDSLKDSIFEVTNALSARIGLVESDNEGVKARLSGLEDAVKNNSACIDKIVKRVSLSGVGGDMDILEEVEDRLARRGKVVLFGVPESKATSLESRKVEDAERVSRICQLLSADQAASTHVRLGKYSPALTRPRPIKLAFEDHSITDKFIQALMSLKRASRLPPDLRNLAIVKDRTQRQRDQHKEMFTELQRRMAAGETSLRLVTRNGMSHIVKSPQMDRQGSAGGPSQS